MIPTLVKLTGRTGFSIYVNPVTVSCVSQYDDATTKIFFDTERGEISVDLPIDEVCAAINNAIQLINCDEALQRLQPPIFAPPAKTRGSVLDPVAVTTSSHAQTHPPNT